jgi:hypothetical protein
MSDFNLYQASNQWATRPDDQRFWTLEDMLAACTEYRNSAREAKVTFTSLHVQPMGGDGAQLAVVGPAGNPAILTHWAMGQLSGAAGAPASYLRSLPADLACTNINYGLAQRGADVANLLIHKNGGLVLRSATSEDYSRIWNVDVINRLLPFRQYGWRVPPARPVNGNSRGARPATEADVLESREGGGGLSVNVGDMIAPAGLYASDHDCFIFMVNEKNRIRDGSEGGLSRGFFLTNSEVGNGKALKVTTFLYRHVCGNHIVWGAEGVQEIKVVHRGEADLRFRRELEAEIRSYAEGSAAEDEAAIASARRFKLGNNKDEVLNGLFKALRGDLSRKTIEASYDQAVLEAEKETTLDPNTAWGYAQGLTAYSQETPYADERSKLDRASGKVLSMAF